MNCKNCNTDLSDTVITAEQSAHDERTIEVQVQCQECDTVHCAFIDFDEFMAQ